jgi:hypothetical protein
MVPSPGAWQCGRESVRCRWGVCLLGQVGGRSFAEAAGIDVYATARGNGFPIEVVRDEGCEQNYYGLVLIE